MVTHVTYREASFKGRAATEAAVEQARAAGWSVSNLREARPGHFVVLFRSDADCPESARSQRPGLPDFAVAPETRQSRGTLAGFIARLFGAGNGSNAERTPAPTA